MKKVYIDAGHGGLTATGYYSTAPNWRPGKPETWRKMFVHDHWPFFEGQFNRIIAEKLARKLESNFEVIKVYDAVLDTPLDDRCQATQNDGVLISIHANAAPSHLQGKVNGLETFHFKGSTKGNKLARCIHDNVAYQTKARNRGVKEGNLQMLRETRCPAALIECGFFDNKEEAIRLLDDDYQNRIVSGIAKGIHQYFN
ncbi:N-acetylmuramoyl-L-alanine amidase [Limibacter armeniacum]|uniref:N-acetylmuramoyl-L-alanine amidase family protein n=1 Tax=Limibacter armeniacum TaxID=466084 RepID=UPI002FE61B78